MTEPVAAPPAPPAAPAKVSRAQLALQLASAALLFWWYGGNLLDALQFPTAELAAFPDPPSLAFPGLVLLATAGALAAAIYGHLKRLGGDFKGHRLLPIVVVVVLFFQVFVVSSTRSAMAASDHVTISVYEFVRLASAASTPERVPTDPAELRAMLKDIGKPPYFIRGERVPEYKLEVRPRCEGPVAEPGGAGPGTLLYCANKAGNAAWVTLVGLPLGRRFGTPSMVGRGDVLLAAEVRAAPEGGEPEEPVETIELEPPMPGARWEDLADAGVFEARPQPAPPPQGAVEQGLVAPAAGQGSADAGP